MQPTTMLPKLTDTTQVITFSEDDGVCSAEVLATEVVVNTNAGNHNHGSSKVKLKNLVDYNWEPKFYSGQLLAIHMSGKYLAYSIKAPNAASPGMWTGMVRVVYSPEPGTDRRALIKGMKGEVQDLAFAHIQNQVVLASIDELGNFYVHEIEATDSGLRCTLVAEEHVEEGAGATATAAATAASHRVVWCPYIPDDDDAPDDDVARLLLTTHANIARMWNIRAGGGGGAGAGALGGGAWGSAHGAPLVDAAFSPDGTALATAAADGYVMFYQVYMHAESSPRCLHKWQPHKGAPLSCLFFLDNHKHYNTDVQFWKFAVTGAENNTIIKIWSCKSWQCLQTLRFGSSPSVGVEGLVGLRAALEASARYLVVSDFTSRCLYVLRFSSDSEQAHVDSICEFPLPYPVLSFCILDAEEEQVKCESSCDDPFHTNGSGGDVPDSPDDFDLNQDDVDPLVGGDCTDEGEKRVRLRLYIVQPKGLQEGELVYCPPTPHARNALEDAVPVPAGAGEVPGLQSSILQQQSQQLQNLLMRSQTQPGSLIVPRAESPTIAPPLNLMTPDAFSSPGKREEDDPPLSATPDVQPTQRPSNQGIPATEAAGTVTSGSGSGGGSGGVGGGELHKLTSGGSSPSREVRQIMGHNERAYYPHDLENEEPEEEETDVADALTSEVAAEAEVDTADDVFTSNEIYAATDTAPAKINSDTSWPQISMAQISEANQRKASSDKSSSQSLNASLQPADRLSPADRSRLLALDHKIDKLTGTVLHYIYLFWLHGRPTAYLNKLEINSSDKEAITVPHI
ncbi:hypothetical protein evm_005027 [Chilo suppressalis]|nr:hypothetical protein evm_005027 [Chilo suppressalis]